MKRKNLLSLLCLLLSFCLFAGCQTQKAVNLGEPDTEAHTEAHTEATEPVTEPTDTMTEPTEPVPEPTEPVDPPEDKIPLERPAVPHRVENKYDYFVRDEIIVNNSEYVISEEAQQGLFDVMNYDHYAYYDVAFYVLDLNTQMSFGYNATDYFNPGCTRKAGFALSWFKQIEETRKKFERGQPVYVGESTVTKDTRYFYDGYDYLEGAGYVGRHGYRWYTVEELLYYMIHESDNTAYNALWRLLGINKYKSMCVKLGIPEHPDEYRRDKLWTPMRPLDIGLIWQEIWKYKDSGSHEAEAMWHYFTHNNFNEIVKVVKDADLIAHKAGSDDYGFHEAGIVVRGDNAYVVVAMSTVPLPIANDDYDVIHMVIERIDPIMQDYYEWLEQSETESEDSVGAPTNSV